MEANAFALARLHELATTRPPSEEVPPTKVPSVAEFLIDYLPIMQMRVEPSTFRAVVQLLSVAAKHFQDTPLDRIRRGDVESWLARISTRLRR